MPAALEQQIVREQVAVNDPLRQLALQVEMQVLDFLVESASYFAEVCR